MLATPEPSHIYFVVALQLRLIKIGYAKDLAARLSGLRCHSPDTLVLLGAMESDEPRVAERAIHERFAHLKQRAEWYRPADELLDFIAENTTFIFDDHWEITAEGAAIDAKRIALNPSPDAH